MTQHPQPSTSPSPNQSKRDLQRLDWVKWIGITLFPLTLLIQIYGIYTNQNTTVAVITAIITFLGIIVQFSEKIYTYIKDTWRFGVRIFVVALVILPCVAYILIAKPVPTPGGSESSLDSKPSPVVSAVSSSSLIPKEKEPIVDDPLGDNSQGYGWDEGPNAQKTGSCEFSQGLYYVISAPAGSPGIGCNTETSKGNFTNFVYQIKMTILEGVDSEQSAVGPNFRLNNKGGGYEVGFDQNGNWSVNSTVGTLSQAMVPFPFFRVGINQPNFITIRAEGSSIKIQVNGHDLISITDSISSSGFVGVQMNPGAKAGKVAFNNMRVWEL